MNVKHLYIGSKPYDSFPMTSRVPRRHPVSFRARPRENPKTCIITFNFGCFCDIFELFLACHIFFWNIPRSANKTCIICAGVWHNLHCLEKPLNTRFVHFSWNPKLPRNDCKGIHIFVPSQMTFFQCPPIFLGSIQWRSELGPRKTKSVYYNLQFLQFATFWNFFGLVITIIIKSISCSLN